MQQASDFLDECQALENLLRSLDVGEFETPTAFKEWTVNNILRHLHVWNYVADLSIRDGEACKRWIDKTRKAMVRKDLTLFEAEELNKIEGIELLDTWSAFYNRMAARFAEVDPSTRLEWAGPSMSARSSISARQMETWAHGQAIYDVLGLQRNNFDRIRNIVVMGYNTYGWTFRNRRLEPPSPQPQLELVAPSGTTWTLGEDAGVEKISGHAEEFCQVVTQTRSIADTNLVASGENATLWMSIAQCFAGPAVDPPPAGLRKIRTAASIESSSANLSLD